jgi:DNA-directed RNA polymerase subunit RPC12/RpoP
MMMLPVIALIMLVLVIVAVRSAVTKKHSYANTLTEDGAIVVKCCSCGQTLNIPAQYAGQHGTCNHCHSRIVVPPLSPVRITARQWKTSWTIGIALLLGCVFMESQTRYIEMRSPIIALDRQGLPQQVGPGMPESKALFLAVIWVFVPLTFGELCLWVMIWSTVALVALFVWPKRRMRGAQKTETKEGDT